MSTVILIVIAALIAMVLTIMTGTLIALTYHFGQATENIRRATEYGEKLNARQEDEWERKHADR